MQPFLPAHWEQAWKLTEAGTVFISLPKLRPQIYINTIYLTLSILIADLSNPEVTEQKYADMGMQIYKDATAIRDNLNILLSGRE